MLFDVLPIATSLILASGAPTCPERPPIVTFKTDVKKTEYSREKDVSQITQDFSLNGGQVGDNSVVRGTTTPQIKLNYKIKPKILKTRSGHLCGYAQKVDIVLTASPIIHSANDYEYGSCEYREIIKHENEHVQISKDLIRDYQIRVKKDLTERIRDISGHRAIDASKAQELSFAINQATVAVIIEIENELRTEHSRRQAAIDTPENYAEIQSRCVTWNRLR